MSFYLRFTPTALKALKELKEDRGLPKRYKAQTKSLTLLSENHIHPSLQTHEYYSLRGPNSEKIFEAYAEHDTPAAYRIFFHYGPQKNEMTIFVITPHP